MAIGIGSYVAFKKAQSSQYATVPRFGIVADAGGGAGLWDVLWDDGEREDDTPAAALDEILFVTFAPIVVRVDDPTSAGVSAEFTYLVLSFYTRGADPSPYYLLRNIVNGGVVEQQAADVTILER